MKWLPVILGILSICCGLYALWSSRRAKQYADKAQEHVDISDLHYLYDTERDREEWKTPNFDDEFKELRDYGTGSKKKK